MRQASDGHIEWAQARPHIDASMGCQAIRNFTNPTSLRVMLKLANTVGVRYAPRYTAKLLGTNESAVLLLFLQPRAWRLSQTVYPAHETLKARVRLLLGCAQQVLFDRWWDRHLINFIAFASDIVPQNA